MSIVTKCLLPALTAALLSGIGCRSAQTAPAGDELPTRGSTAQRPDAEELSGGPESLIGGTIDISPDSDGRASVKIVWEGGESAKDSAKSYVVVVAAVHPRRCYRVHVGDQEGKSWCVIGAPAEELAELVFQLDQVQNGKLPVTIRRQNMKDVNGWVAVDDGSYKAGDPANAPVELKPGADGRATLRVVARGLTFRFQLAESS